MVKKKELAVKKKELQVASSKEIQGININQMSPAEIMFHAIEKGGSLDNMEKFLELQERYEANQAKKEFNIAMVDVQGQIGTVKKTKPNVQTHSKYANLENILEVAKPVCADMGFSLSFYEGEAKTSDNIRVCCDVVHKSGHEKNYFYDVPLDGKGLRGNSNMTAIHGKASSAAYGRRYLTCMILNIATGDNDGNNGIPKEAPKKEAPAKAAPAKSQSYSAPPESEEQEPIDVEGKVEEKAEFMNQEEFTNLIKVAVKNKWMPDAIEKQFSTLGYKILSQMKMSLKLSDLSEPVNTWDYEIIRDTVSKPPNKK